MLERDDEGMGDPSTESRLVEAKAVLEAVEAALNGEPVSDFMESFPLVQKAQEAVLWAKHEALDTNVRVMMETQAALQGKMVADEFKNHLLVKQAVEVSSRAEKWADFPVRVADVKTEYGEFIQATVYLDSLEGWGLSRKKDRAVAYAFEDLADRLRERAKQGAPR